MRRFVASQRYVRSREVKPTCQGHCSTDANDPKRTLNGPSLYHLAGQGDQHSDLMSGGALDWSQTAEIAALFAGL